MKLPLEDPTIARRRSPKFWEPYSWAVRVFVERGFGTTDACRRVMEKGGIEVTKENLACLRVRYYQIRYRTWPANLESLRTPQEEARPVGSVEAEYGEPFEDSEGDLIDEEGAIVGTVDVDDFEV